MKPTLGRIVHYQSQTMDDVSAAMIVGVEVMRSNTIILRTFGNYLIGASSDSNVEVDITPDSKYPPAPGRWAWPPRDGDPK